MRLAELRKARGLSQRQLAEDLQISQNSISQYELGKREPNQNTLLALANYFAVSVDYQGSNTTTVTSDVARVSTAKTNAAKLVAEVAPGWLKALRPGAGVALAYNSLTTPRHQLAAAMEQAGFEVLPQVEGLEHRVDQAILRDVLVARK